MTQHKDETRVDDVLMTYAVSSPGPGYEQLRDWIAKYPQYAEELIDFTAQWAVIHDVPMPADLAAVDEKRLVLRGMSIVRNLLHAAGVEVESIQQQEQLDAAQPLESLLQAARDRHMSLQDIAERGQLSVALVRKLDRRLIRLDTIPNELIILLASIVGCSSRAITEILRGAPTLPRGAQYRAEQAPEVGEPESFAEALSRDRTMPEEWRRYWLALSSAPGRTADEPHGTPSDEA
jgi:hypothetical protein